MTEIIIINETLSYDQLYDRLIHAYPDKKLHKLKIDQSSIVGIPQSVKAVFTYKLPQAASVEEPEVQIVTIDKFLGFDIGDNVAITNCFFKFNPSNRRSVFYKLLNKLGVKV